MAGPNGRAYHPRPRSWLSSDDRVREEGSDSYSEPKTADVYDVGQLLSAFQVLCVVAQNMGVAIPLGISRGET